ncbi:hypothetical protein HPB50_013814 [Hyalomma asiaticum]|uniref:Uncharacterized protein n=1 Tax=Hyalomma asiaticum TaxID=266040 RepID=A0ACB7T1W9_HYAAI|nr:hypothetical protein HPB50_013814 [Hyalomma asiaticum]
MHHPAEEQPKREEARFHRRSVSLHSDSDGRPVGSDNQADDSSLLSSPDVNRLRLSSPEIRRFVSPLAKMGSLPILSPTELFAFIEAEEEEHCEGGTVGPFGQRAKQPTPAFLLEYDSMDTCNSVTSKDSSTALRAVGDGYGAVKVEPGTVPQDGAVPPLSAIDMRGRGQTRQER